jgi:hypothetical protein
LPDLKSAANVLWISLAPVIWVLVRLEPCRNPRGNIKMADAQVFAQHVRVHAAHMQGWREAKTIDDCMLFNGGLPVWHAHYLKLDERMYEATCDDKD